MATDIFMKPENVHVPSQLSHQSQNQIEQFLLLAKSTKGAAALELVKQVLESNGVYVFGELLEIPAFAELAKGPHAKYYNTLNLFAYGNYKDYLNNPKEYIELTTVMTTKLQHLTIVSMAMKTKCIPYHDLLIELNMKNVRVLEDVIIEAIYSDIIHGKLDQKNSQLEIDYALGRDIRPEDINKISGTLQEWSENCETILSTIEQQINRANSEKSKRIKHKEQIEHEIVNLKKALKTQMTDADEAMQSEPRESTSGQENRKRSCKSKSTRPSGSGVKLHR